MKTRSCAAQYGTIIPRCFQNRLTWRQFEASPQSSALKAKLKRLLKTRTPSAESSETL